MNKPTREIRVLIADNDLDICRRVEECLREAGQSRITICQSVQEVRRLPKEPQFDLCIFDILFNEVNRLPELLEIAHCRWPNSFVCVLSNFLGDLDPDDKRVNAAISKPLFLLEPSVLKLNLLKAMLHTGRPPQEPGSSSLGRTSGARATARRVYNWVTATLSAKGASGVIPSSLGHKVIQKQEQVDLGKLFDDCFAATGRHDKGKKLETFLATFLSSIDGFSVPNDGINLRTVSEELDVVVEINGTQHHVQFGTFTICECKNWRSPVSWDELAKLREKLEARGCIFGIFVALNGVTTGFREKLKAFLRDGVTIALLTRDDLAEVKLGRRPIDILLKAFYATKKYEGEEYQRR